MFFQCVLVLGDNLGLNQICGFEGSFSANYYCRRCTLSSKLCQCVPYEVVEKLRTVENYEEDLKYLRNGIKRPCIFNSLLNFHIARCSSADIMHDIWKGVARYLLEGVLTYLILVLKIITLQEVNHAIKNFSYGSLESKNVLQPLEMKACSEDLVTGIKSKIRCKQSASEMACLTRYLSLMIGDRISHKSNDY